MSPETLERDFRKIAPIVKIHAPNTPVCFEAAAGVGRCNYGTMKVNLVCPGRSPVGAFPPESFDKSGEKLRNRRSQHQLTPWYSTPLPTHLFVSALRSLCATGVVFIHLYPPWVFKHRGIEP